MAASPLDHDTVLETVRHWPRDAQLALAQDILRDAAGAGGGAGAPATRELARPDWPALHRSAAAIGRGD